MGTHDHRCSMIESSPTAIIENISAGQSICLGSIRPSYTARHRLSSEIYFSDLLPLPYLVSLPLHGEPFTMARHLVSAFSEMISWPLEHLYWNLRLSATLVPQYCSDD